MMEIARNAFIIALTLWGASAVAGLAAGLLWVRLKRKKKNDRTSK